MKQTTKLLLLVMAAAGTMLADTVAVDFGSLDQPYNIGQNIAGGTIGQNTHTIDNLTLSYEPDPAALDPGVVATSLCSFDAGLGGISPVPGCSGAQVDTGGIFGTTDGSLILRFASPADSLQFPFALLGFAGLPVDQTFGVTAVFSLDGNFVDAFALNGGDPVSLGDPLSLSSGNFSFSTLPFDLAVINFSPTYVTDPNTGQPSFGQTSFQISDMSYNAVPEPATFIVVACGLLFIGAGRLRKRKQ